MQGRVWVEGRSRDDLGMIWEKEEITYGKITCQVSVTSLGRCKPLTHTDTHNPLVSLALPPDTVLS